MGDVGAAAYAVSAISVERLEALLEERLGLCCVDWQRARLADMLAQNRRLQELVAGTRRFSRAELQLLVEQVSVGETYFFREPGHFSVLAATAVPDRLQNRTDGRPLRILTVGCASGEETYSAAIALRDYHHELAAGRIVLQGIDVHAALLGKAERARYSAWALRATPQHLREECFRRDGQDYRLRDELRTLVHFEERNLFDLDAHFWRPGSVDILFCRNVLIYFSERSLHQAVARFSSVLADGGFLFLGHSETLRGTSADFEQHHSQDTFYYRKKPALPAPPLTPAQPALGSSDPEEGPTDAAWFERIQKSTERVAKLTSTRTPPESERVAERVAEPPSRRDAESGWAPFAPVLELIAAEQFDLALERLAKLPAALAHSPTATLIATTILCGQGRRAASQQAGQRLLDGGQHVAEAHFLLGLSYEHLGDTARAQSSYEQALCAAPQFAMAHLHAGILLRRGGQRQKARSALRQALELLAHEPKERIILFGGGFQREALISLCRAELRGLGGEP